MLTREQILAAEDRPTMDVQVPEWGGAIRIRALTGSEMEELVALSTVNGHAVNMQAWMAVRSVCDEQGGRVFADEDIGEVCKKSHSALQRVAAAFNDLNRLSPEQQDELEGN